MSAAVWYRLAAVFGFTLPVVWVVTNHTVPADICLGFLACDGLCVLAARLRLRASLRADDVRFWLRRLVP